MEKEVLCKGSNNHLIEQLSNALVEHGVIEGSQHYYEDENFNFPFFKVPKPFKKESPDDPDVHYVFIDVDDAGEYTIHGNYVHEHIADAGRTAELVAKLIKAEVVEVAIVYPDRFAGFFVTNTGDPEKNVNIIAENFETIKSYLDTDMTPMLGGHMHMLLPQILPYYLQYGPTTEYRIPGINIYMVSSVLSEHPEYYVIQ